MNKMFNCTSCNHDLEVLTDNIKYREVSTTPIVLWLAGPGWQSHRIIAIADVKCRKCGRVFLEAAEKTNKKGKRGIAASTEWVIDKKKITKKR